MPDHWIRRQTLSNEERFVTPELKEREGRILQLKARSHQREYDLFCRLRDQLVSKPQHPRCRSGDPCLDALADSQSWQQPKAVAGPNSQLAAAWRSRAAAILWWSNC